MKQKLSLIIALCLLAAMLVSLAVGVINSQRVDIPSPQRLPLTQGEYSTDGGKTWLPMTEDTSLQRNRGNVILRGHVSRDIQEGEFLNVHLQHMGLTARINGTEVFTFATASHAESMGECVNHWVNIPLPAVQAQDVLELELHPRHLLGLDGADCVHLAENLYIADPILLNLWLEDQNTPQRLFGQIILVVGLTLLGISTAALIMKSPLHKILFYTALLALGEGSLWFFGASAIVNGIGGTVAFHSLAVILSRVLISFALMAGVSQLLLRRSAEYAPVVACAQGILSLLFILISILHGHAFCYYELLWNVVQIPFVLAMLVLCIFEAQDKKYTVRHRFFILAHIVAFAAILITFASRLLGWEAGIHVEKVVCGLMTLCYASALFFQMPASHEAIQSAKRLSEELNQSRIVLAMSQIRTHFIFNVLNAISSLCKTDPEQADEELVRFSRYLRANINLMQEDKPIPFEQEMDHVMNYIDLEQLRFDERIMVDEQYEVTDFMLPSLIVQPLVENAIKHGLLPKAEGGLIRLSTYRQGSDVVIEIADDGVGFAAKSKSTHKSVGLSNVRFRVEKMAGGRLVIESQEGVGTVVKVILPYQKEEVV